MSKVDPWSPEALTEEEVRGLLQAIRRAPSEFKENLAAYCTMWLRWHEHGCDPLDFNAPNAARIIADAINIRAKASP